MRREEERSVSDPRVRRYVTPARIVWQTEGVRNGEVLPISGAACIMEYVGDGQPSLLVDFGRELHGGVQIENGITPAHAPIPVRVRFGESVSEAMSEPNNDHAIHDSVCLVPWYGCTEVGNTGFRFVRIDLVEPGTRLDLKALRAVSLYRDLPYRGTFRCNDERLNRIWNTGAYTVHLCMQDMLWDGIKRDRLVWIGDIYPETMVVNTVFGEIDVVPRSLDFVRNTTPLPQWMNGISSYSLWWILTHDCWFRYHGNRECLEEQRPYLLGLLDLLSENIGEDGSERLGDTRFLDWPTSEDPAAIHAGLHALLLLAFKAGARLCATLGESRKQEMCESIATQLAEYRPGPTPNKQANALLSLAGLAGPAGETNRAILGVNPLRGLSTFYGYYVLQARALAGDFAGCLDVIRQYWGAMLDLGATTFWEDFDLDWTENAAGIDEIVPKDKADIHADFGNYCYRGLRHSLCHGWAAGPTAWLTEHVLGCRPIEPGAQTIEVAPHLGDLEWAEGTFPTPRGNVRIGHRRTHAGDIDTNIEAPEGVCVIRSKGTT